VALGSIPSRWSSNSQSLPNLQRKPQMTMGFQYMYIYTYTYKYSLAPEYLPIRWVLWVYCLFISLHWPFLSSSTTLLINYVLVSSELTNHMYMYSYRNEKILCVLLCFLLFFPSNNVFWRVFQRMYALIWFILLYIILHYSGYFKVFPVFHDYKWNFNECPCSLIFMH
jgi:hypothetical protein